MRTLMQPARAAEKTGDAYTRNSRHEPGRQVGADQRNEITNNSPRSLQLKAMADMIADGPRMAAQSVASRPNLTGLPDQLKSGVEHLSGISLDHVKVHYNSAEPAQLNAHAYAQGHDIYVAPGQEHHLPHEAWHVVQQAQSRVRPTRQMKNTVPVNDDAGLEHEADVMGQKALQFAGHAAVTTSPPTSMTALNPTVQRRAIANLSELKSSLIALLDAAEKAAGSDRNLLSGNAGNIARLTHLYTPGAHNAGSQNILLKVDANNKLTEGGKWKESWYDRVDARVTSGATQMIKAILFWSTDMQRVFDVAEPVVATSAELLGEELHDRGLGPAKVDFEVEFNHNPLVVFTRTYVIKPEDRSIEKAILGSENSVATYLNAHMAHKGQQVNTLDIKTDEEHGTMMEYVTTSLHSLAERVVRTLKNRTAFDTPSVETLGFALLTGLYDLHSQNVMQKGGAPALIDADVAVRPKEFKQGPSQQAGFSKSATEKVTKQIGGDHAGASRILQYAIDHPDDVIETVIDLVGKHRARIVPVFTGTLSTSLADYVSHKEYNKNPEAVIVIQHLAKYVKDGYTDGSPGLKKELGANRGPDWRQDRVGKSIETDFDKGVIPHFQYEPYSGQVFLHGFSIWRGKTLKQSLADSRTRLVKAKK